MSWESEVINSHGVNKQPEVLSSYEQRLEQETHGRGQATVTIVHDSKMDAHDTHYSALSLCVHLWV